VKTISKIIGDKPWFMPKRIGVGASFPIAWQGWVVLAIFVAGMAANAYYLRGPARPIVAAVLVGLLFVIAQARRRAVGAGGGGTARTGLSDA